MLYAVLMVAVFSLVLQFYLHIQLSEARATSAYYESTEAYLMAEWTADIAREEIRSKGQMTQSLKQERNLKMEKLEVETARKGTRVEGKLRFSKGHSHYQAEDTQLFVTVTTISGHEFSYSFSFI